MKAVSQKFRQAAKDTGRSVGRTDQRQQAVARSAIRKGSGIAASALHVFGNALESLFAPPTPKTQAQAKHEAQQGKSAAQEQQIQLDQFIHASDHERRQAHIAEQDQQKRTEREGYERLQKERGGRER